MGILKPKSGKVLLDSKNLSIDNKWWLSEISYVPQENIILEGTLLQNVTLFEPKIDITKFKKAINLAGLNDFVKLLPNKENTFLKENLNNISGGEAKRISIARALYKKTNLLFLDEPTNGLDKKSKLKIIESIYKLKGKKTIIIITHLNDFINCDNKIDL